MKIAEIQLTDVARAWWLMEEVGLEKPVAWSLFSKKFYRKFFPEIAKKKLRQQFIRLKQQGRTVDEYAAEFQKLSRFAKNMVADEEDRADQFQ